MLFGFACGFYFVLSDGTNFVEEAGAGKSPIMRPSKDARKYLPYFASRTLRPREVHVGSSRSLVGPMHQVEENIYFIAYIHMLIPYASHPSKSTSPFLRIWVSLTGT